MTDRPRTAGAALVVALSALLVVACPQRPETREVADLVAGFSLARRAAETTLLDLGTESARSSLVSGWSGNHSSAASSSTYVVNTGVVTEIHLEVVEPRDLALILDGRPITRDRPVRVTVELNGEPLGEIEMAAATEPPYLLSVTGDRFVRGTNRLRLLHPIEEGTRSAARIAWYGVKLGDVERSADPSAVPDRGLLVLPAGTSAEYLLDLPSDSTLVVDGWQFRGDPAPSVEVTVETDEEGARSVAVVKAGVRAAAIDLGLAERRIARVSLRTIDLDETAPDGSAALNGPRIVTTAPAEEPIADVAIEAQRRPPNVVIYLVDTLRADHLGCYGYGRDTSPHIDRFAAGATLYERAVAQSSWTRASVASVLTGVWPEAHGAIGRKDALIPDATTLGELLGEAGYQTGAIVTNPNVYRSFGFDQGFDRWVQLMGNLRRSRIVTKGASELLAEFDLERPFFLYLHTIDPHHPYLPAPDLRARFAPDTDALLEKVREEHTKERWLPEEADGLSGLYDAEIAQNDRSFGGVRELLEELGIYDSTLVVFTSDHGEEFFEHGAWGHGKNLRAANLDVPLIVKYPGQVEAERSSAAVQHVDILPTVLALAGVETPPHVEGRPLPRPGDPAERYEPPLFSHLRLDGPQTVSLTEGRWKLIQTWVSGNVRIAGRQLFDKSVDPGEMRDLAAERPVLAAYLGSRIDAELLRSSYRLTSVEAEIDEELEKSLKALGYLQ